MAFATKYDQIRKELDADKASERKIQRKSVMDTVIAMALLLGILFFLKIPPVYPPLPEAGGGMDIILGSDQVGINNTTEPVAAGSPQNQAPSASAQSAAQVSTPDVAPSNDPDAVLKAQKQPKTQSTKPVNTTTTKTAPNPNQTPEPKVDSRQLFNGHKGPTGNNGTGGTNQNKGTGNKSGNQGDPNGNPNGDFNGGSGGGSGGGHGPDHGLGTQPGTSFRLTGRGIRSAPKPNCNSQVQGKDVIQIYVDKDGNVIDAHGGYRGSTVTDPSIIACDENDVKKVKFTPSPDGTERQEGSYTIVHKLH